ncbi:MAG TPA: enoyl-CoA hydratase [Aldersonia sp.]
MTVEEQVTTTEVGFEATRDAGILRITFTRADRMNALDYRTMVALGEEIENAGSDPDVRVIVLTGTGRAFCSGADLVAVGESRGAGITPTDSMDAVNRLVRAIVQVPVPVIARVTGAAAGIGASLAIAADLAYATENSYLLLAFVNIGLMPDGGASALVAAASGRALAAEMALLGKRLAAREAKAAGLITDVVADEEIDARVEAAARKIANGPRRALELTKRAVNAAALSALEDALAREHEGQTELLTSSDFVEGVAAMLGKRKPEFGP